MAKWLRVGARTYWDDLVRDGGNEWDGCAPRRPLHLKAMKAATTPSST